MAGRWLYGGHHSVFMGLQNSDLWKDIGRVHTSPWRHRGDAVFS